MCFLQGPFCLCFAVESIVHLPVAFSRELISISIGVSPIRIKKSSLKTWLIAVRPWSYSASIIPVLLGLSTAWQEGHPLLWDRIATALLGVLTLHTAGNLINDCYDFKKGLDRDPGPASGAVVRGFLTPRQAGRAALLFILVALFCGTYLTLQLGIIIVLLGGAGVFFAIAYSAPGISLKCAGLGDPVIFLTFGILPALGGYWVLAGSLSWTIVLWSLPLGFHAAAILHANNWRDIGGDLQNGCRTFAALIGSQRSGQYYRILIYAPFFLSAFYIIIAFVNLFESPVRYWGILPFLSLPLAIRLARLSADYSDQDQTEIFDSLDTKTAGLQMLFGLLLICSVLLER